MHEGQRDGGLLVTMMSWCCGWFMLCYMAMKCFCDSSGVASCTVLFTAKHEEFFVPRDWSFTITFCHSFNVIAKHFLWLHQYYNQKQNLFHCFPHPLSPPPHTHTHTVYPPLIYFHLILNFCFPSIIFLLSTSFEWEISRLNLIHKYVYIFTWIHNKKT